MAVPNPHHMLLELIARAVPLLVALAPDPGARAVLDTAAARMGGLATLRSITRLRVDVITEWQRTTLDARPTTPVSSYEWSTELRDYQIPAWRYTRRFFTATGLNEIVDVVVDSVAVFRSGGKWAPMNVAYVDERDELFTISPERLMVLASEATDASARRDTVMGGIRYARVSATVGKFHSTLFFRRGDGLLALARFRAAQPSDFGLAPWGDMEVDIWYSRWSKIAGAGVMLPTQLDVYRVGRPYKRMTALSVAVNPVIAPESLAISDSLRAAFLAGAPRGEFVAIGRRPMFDLPLDSAKIVGSTFALFNTGGTPAGAVKIGGRWLLLEAGAAPLSVQRSVDFLRRTDASPLGGTLITAPAGAGGVAWLAARPEPTWVALGARPYVDAVLRGWRQSGAALRTAGGGSWLRVGSDSVRLETIDLPDYPSTTVVYAPSLRWAYAWPAGPAQADYTAAYVQMKGWAVDRIGSSRAFYGTPLR
ncbi:MAG TPA: hypothetical protein VHE78_10450 [Gemmatimonadaceae bacterium]|nr:hypothetical protein [Gemmatimonadaceae bacterium]